MSIPLSTAVPIVSATSPPVSVRDGSPAARKAYETALDFERMLVGQLSQGLIQSSGLGGESEAGGEASGEAGASGPAGSGLLTALAPQALTEGIVRGGGLGLTGQLMRALDPAAATEDTRSAAAADDPTGGARTAGPAGATGGVSA